MSKLKVGDLVKVEFEARVFRIFSRGDIAVTESDGRRVYLDEKYCTLMKPEVYIPEDSGTIVQIDPNNKSGMREVYTRVGDSWMVNGAVGTFTTFDVAMRCNKYGYRLIAAAEEE